MERSVQKPQSHPDDEELGEIKSRKSQYLQGFLGLGEALKNHLYIKTHIKWCRSRYLFGINSTVVAI